MWFSESEDSKVSDALSQLAATQGLDNHLLYQVEKKLLSGGEGNYVRFRKQLIRWIVNVIKAQTIF